jgi:hypothetical protein
MRRFFQLLLIILLLPLITGMGSQGGTPSDKIPVPAKKFTAIFIDQMDITTECREVSIEGATFLEGKKGEGTFSVAFENIQTVVFRLNEGKLYGLIKLRDGGTMELLLNKERKAYGRTKYGTFQIRLHDLKKIMMGQADQKKG